MSYSIELYMDKEASAAITKIHSILEKNGISIDEGMEPHVSLCIYGNLPIEKFKDELRLFARKIEPFEVSFFSIDAFKTEKPVIFLAPKITPELLDAHLQFHDNFSKYSNSVYEYYKPKVWIPHCTLCMGLSQEMYIKASKILKDIQLPIKGTFEQIGIFKIQPNEQLSIFNLG